MIVKNGVKEVIKSSKEHNVHRNFDEENPRPVQNEEDKTSSDVNLRDHLEYIIDQTLADSFPASDPPAWTLGREVKVL
jgi:hypothetical protein